MMRTSIRRCLVAAVICTLGPAVMLAASLFKPFTATEVTTRYLGNGNLVARETAVIGLRADGSRSVSITKSVIPPGKKTGPVRSSRKIIDFSRHRNVVLFPGTKSISTMQLTAPAPAPPSSCEALGRQLQNRRFDPNPAVGELLGYKVVSVSGDLNFGARRLHVVKWLAPALDCTELREESTATTADGSPTARSVSEVVSVMEGNPPADLFAVPADYTERSPSEAIRAEEAQIPGYTACTKCEAKHLAEVDATYAKHRVNR